jgi:C-terminal processing protease CtpA/Prc
MLNNCKKCGSSLVISTIIESFYPDSDAEKSSLKVGDKILEINKIPVDTNADIVWATTVPIAGPATPKSVHVRKK